MLAAMSIRILRFSIGSSPIECKESRAGRRRREPESGEPTSALLSVRKAELHESPNEQTHGPENLHLGVSSCPQSRGATDRAFEFGMR